MVEVMIVDDQKYARMGLTLMIGKDSRLHVVLQAANGQEAVDAINQRAATGACLPDVVLMDVRMPVMDGIDATRRITGLHPSVKVLVLTTYDQDDYAFGGLNAGASGFLLKDVTAGELCHAVHAVASGDAVLTPRITREVLGRCTGLLPQGGQQDHRREAFASLTPREREVASLIAEGLSNAEIAEQLVVETASVRRYVSRILAKLGLRDRVQVAVEWYRTGM